MRGRTDFFAEDSSSGIDGFEIDLLRKFKSKFVLHNLAGDQHNRGTVSIGFPDTVDEMKAARSARSSTHGKFTGQQSVGPGGKCPGLLVPDMNPSYVASANGIGYVIQCVARHTIASLCSSGGQGLYYHISYTSRHNKFL